MRFKPAWFRHDLLTLLDLLKQGKIKPLIAQRLPLDEARRAHEMLGEGGVLGKIVLLPNGVAEKAPPGMNLPIARIDVRCRGMTRTVPTRANAQARRQARPTSPALAAGPSQARTDVRCTPARDRYADIPLRQPCALTDIDIRLFLRGSVQRGSMHYHRHYRCASGCRSNVE